MSTASEDGYDAIPSTEPPHILTGELVARVDGGPLAPTSFYVDIDERRILIRYGDGIDHIGRRGDDLIAFFSGLVPSLMPVAGQVR